MDTVAIDSVLHWLLRTSLEGTVLVAAVLVLRRVLGVRLSAPWRSTLWLLVGLKLMLPACIPAGIGLGGWLHASGTAEAPAESVIPAVQGWREIGPMQALASNLPPEEQKAGPLPERLSNFTQQSRSGILFLGWLAGGLTIAASALLRLRRLESQLHTRPCSDDPGLLAKLTELRQLAGVKRPVGVVLMPSGTTPAVVGIQHPRILLPEDWQTRFDDRELRHVLLHELVHVRRHDLIWNWIALAVHALHWFNPLVWLAVTRFQADRELRCDARVLELLEPRERLNYGQTLLRIQETFFAPPATAGLAPCVRNHPSLRERITMIAQSTTRRPWLQTALTVLVAGLACYSFSTARAEREDDLPPRERSPEGEPKLREERQETGEKIRTTERRDGESRETAERDGAARKTGPRDDEGEKRGPREGEVKKTGPRDGEVRKVGPRDGEDRKTGPRDGDGVKRPGPREGDAAVKKPLLPPSERPVKKPLLPPGERPVKKPLLPPGERPVKKPLLPPGERPVKKPASDEAAQIQPSGEVLSVRVIDGGKTVLVGRKEVAMNGLRAVLSEALPRHAGARVIVTADADVPYGTVLDTLDAVRDNGAKHATIERE